MMSATNSSNSNISSVMTSSTGSGYSCSIPSLYKPLLDKAKEIVVTSGTNNTAGVLPHLVSWLVGDLDKRSMKGRDKKLVAMDLLDRFIQDVEKGAIAFIQSHLNSYPTLMAMCDQLVEAFVMMLNKLETCCFK